MGDCICCHSVLLRHIRHNTIYWYCPRCHQEMPRVVNDLNFHKFVKRKLGLASLEGRIVAYSSK